MTGGDRIRCRVKRHKMIIVDLVASPLSNPKVLLFMRLPIIKQDGRSMIEHQIIRNSRGGFQERIDFTKEFLVKVFIKGIEVNMRKPTAMKNQIVSIDQISGVIHTAAFIFI